MEKEKKGIEFFPLPSTESTNAEFISLSRTRRQRRIDLIFPFVALFDRLRWFQIDSITGWINRRRRRRRRMRGFFSGFLRDSWPRGGEIYLRFGRWRRRRRRTFRCWLPWRSRRRSASRGCSVDASSCGDSGRNRRRSCRSSRRYSILRVNESRHRPTTTTTTTTTKRDLNWSGLMVN